MPCAPCERKPMQLCGDYKCDGQVMKLPACGDMCLPKFESPVCCRKSCWESEASGSFTSIEMVSSRAQFLAMQTVTNKIFLVTNDISLGQISTIEGLDSLALIGVKSGAVKPCKSDRTYVGFRKNGEVYDSIIFFKGTKHWCPTYEYYVVKKRKISFNLELNGNVGVIRVFANSVIGFLDFEACGDVEIGVNPGVNFGVSGSGRNGCGGGCGGRLMAMNNSGGDNAVSPFELVKSWKPAWVGGGGGVGTLAVVGVGILFNAVSASLVESVDLHVSRTVMFSDSGNIGAFAGEISDSKINRSNVVGKGNGKCGSVFGLLSTFVESYVGGFVGRNDMSTFYDCGVKLSGYHDVQIGYVNPYGMMGSVGGFCGMNIGTIECSKVDMCDNKNVVMGLPFGKESGIVFDPNEPEFFGLIGPILSFEVGVGFGVGGFCGLSYGMLKSNEAFYVDMCNVVIGGDVYVEGDVVNSNVGAMVGSGVGVGGFCGAIVDVNNKDGVDVGMDGCVLVVKKCRDVMVGMNVYVGGRVVNSVVGGNLNLSLCGVGGFYGSNLDTSGIERCVTLFGENRVVHVGFNVCVGEVTYSPDGESIVGSLSEFRESNIGIGGFGGLTLLEPKDTLVADMRGCGMFMGDNYDVTIGVAVVVDGNVDRDGVVGCMSTRGMAGEGGFFGVLLSSNYTKVKGCVGCVNGGKYVVVGNRVYIGGCVSENSRVAMVGPQELIGLASFDGVNVVGAIGGFGGFGYSNASIAFNDCVLVYGDNCDVKIGAVGGCAVQENPPLLYGGIGGFWGYCIGYLAFNCNADAVYRNKCQMLVYRSSPNTCVHMNKYVGYCTSDPVEVGGES